MKRAGLIAALGVAALTAASAPTFSVANAAVAAPTASAEECVPAASDAHDHDGLTLDAKPGHSTEPQTYGLTEQQIAKYEAQFAKDAKKVDSRLARGGGGGGGGGGKRTVKVKVYWHVVHDGSKGKISKTRIKNQLKLAEKLWNGKRAGNAKKKRLKFKLTLKKATYTQSKQYFDFTQNEDKAMKSSIRGGKAGKKGRKNLHVYSVQPAESETYAGYANYAQFAAQYGVQDGVLVSHQTVPGDTSLPNNPYKGKTFPHEVGHWLGLYHTFEGGCAKGKNDRVKDTPKHKQPAQGDRDKCQGQLKACIVGKKYPEHNIMNYHSDDCRTEFTYGQVRRAFKQWKVYRLNAVR